MVRRSGFRFGVIDGQAMSRISRGLGSGDPNKAFSLLVWVFWLEICLFPRIRSPDSAHITYPFLCGNIVKGRARPH